MSHPVPILAAEVGMLPPPPPLNAATAKEAGHTAFSPTLGARTRDILCAYFVTTNPLSISSAAGTDLTDTVDLIYSQAFLNGRPVAVQVDTGATASFITTAAFRAGNLKSYSIPPVQVRLADGKTLMIDQKSKARLRVLTRGSEGPSGSDRPKGPDRSRYHHTPVDLYILPPPPGEVAPPQVGVYLGTDWLYTNRAKLDYSQSPYAVQVEPVKPNWGPQLPHGRPLHYDG